ncbi:sugar kinase [Bacillus sp. FJAT-50079]|uniref:sugar kinase n=1 Tax=Bacillus sp. FJAT-50079 TaxID=2833577 RepID=UPI001BC8E07E|nr:sugar kinase [Bacillus sp. FJAT-50079]MBS4208836.1 sugar kinase [Bacillus sp. FJAT-50079]
MGFDVTTIGEGSLRLSVPAGKRLNLANSFEIGVSGAEANVVGCLSRLGRKTGWISCLPETPVGKRVRNEYRSHGINVDNIIWSNQYRLATLYVEYATPPRSTNVIFDRKNTCFTNIRKEDVDWSYLLDSKIIHLTGITVALSENTKEIVQEAIKRAREKGVPISFDVNYRSTLWSKEEAYETMLPMIQNVEVLFCSKRDAEFLFGCEGSDHEIIRQLQKKSNASKVVMSRGASGVLGLEDDVIYEEPARKVVIIDRIGAGDGLAGGVLYGWLEGDFAKGLKYGVLTAALALSQYGEVVNTNPKELNLLLEYEAGDIVR